MHVILRVSYSGFILFFFILCLSSCKSKQVLQQPTLTLTQEELITEFLKQPDYTFISGKAKVSFQSDFGSGKATLYLRTIKDSVIWMAAKKVSVEVGRVQITQDSIFIINRLEKSYIKSSLEEAEEKYGLTSSLAYIQSMLIATTPTIDTTGYWEVNYDSTDCSIKTMSHDILHKFVVDKETGKVRSGSFKDKFVAEGQWAYDNYEYELGKVDIPKNRSYSITNAVGDLITMDATFTDWEVDVPKSIKFSIPSHYTQIQ